MTSCIHNIRLNQLKQLIQYVLSFRAESHHTIMPRSILASAPSKLPALSPPSPRADPQGSSPKRQGSIPEVDELLAKLAQWRACNPVLPPGRTGVPLLPKDVFDLEYYNVR
jgi:hypothetical protein